MAPASYPALVLPVTRANVNARANVFILLSRARRKSVKHARPPAVVAYSNRVRPPVVSHTFGNHVRHSAPAGTGSSTFVPQSRLRRTEIKSPLFGRTSTGGGEGGVGFFSQRNPCFRSFFTARRRWQTGCVPNDKFSKGLYDGRSWSLSRNIGGTRGWQMTGIDLPSVQF